MDSRIFCWDWESELGWACSSRRNPAKETRDLLLSKADEGKEFLKKQTFRLKDNAGDLLNKGRDVISRQKDTLKRCD